VLWSPLTVSQLLVGTALCARPALAKVHAIYVKQQFRDKPKRHKKFMEVAEKMHVGEILLDSDDHLMANSIY